MSFLTSTTHLDAELRHLDLLLRQAAIRFAETWGAVETHQGIYVTREEIDHLLSPGRHPDESPLDGEIETSRARIDAAAAESEAAGTVLPLPRLVRRLGLDADEAQILVACLAPELDRGYDRIYAYLQDDLARRRPSADLVTSLITGPRQDRWAIQHLLAPQAPLIASGVLRVVPDPASPSGSTALARLLQISPIVLAYLLGQRELDPALVDAARFVSPGDLAEDPSMAPVLRILENRGAATIVQVHGETGVGRAGLVRRLLANLGTAHVEVSCPALPAAPGPRAESIRAAVFQAWLYELPVVFVDADSLLYPQDPNGAGATREHLLDSVLPRFPSLILLTGTRPWPAGPAPAGYTVHRVALTRPDRTAREVIWRETLSAAGLGSRPEWAPVLAGQLRLNAGQVADVAQDVRDAVLGRTPATTGIEDWLTAARGRAAHRLEGLAHRVRLGRGWDDLVLEPGRATLLREICDQVRLRDTVLDRWGMAGRTGLARGLSVLFCGPPGTGKTMAAGVIAAELGLELFAIDLSQVVSKYIGETEKNLSRVFAAAEDCGAVLLFDEADALFGARTGISDAHDRYANIETSYLLQRMEEYDGIAVLSTNLRQNMDEAFLRRLRFVVDFPLPDVAQRHRIWERHLGDGPTAVPVNDLDLGLLAGALPVAGGSIRNIALAAAFLAASEGSAVAMPHVLGAARREFEKLGKLWREPSTQSSAGRAGVLR